MSIYPEGGGEASDLFVMWLFAFGGGGGVMLNSWVTDLLGAPYEPEIGTPEQHPC